MQLRRWYVMLNFFARFASLGTWVGSLIQGVLLYLRGCPDFFLWTVLRLFAGHARFVFAVCFFRLLALLAQGGVLDLVSSVLAGPLVSLFGCLLVFGRTLVSCLYSTDDARRAVLRRLCITLPPSS